MCPRRILPLTDSVQTLLQHLRHSIPLGSNFQDKVYLGCLSFGSSSNWSGMMNTTVFVRPHHCSFIIRLTNERMCRVLRILCTRPRRTRHGCARTWSSPSRHPIFVYLGTADHACCAPWEALRAGKKIHRWDDCGTNVAGNV